MFVYKQSNETSTLKNIGKGHTLTFSLPKRPFAEQPLIDNRAENPSKWGGDAMSQKFITLEKSEQMCVHKKTSEGVRAWEL